MFLFCIWKIFYFPSQLTGGWSFCDRERTIWNDLADIIRHRSAWVLWQRGSQVRHRRLGRLFLWCPGCTSLRFCSASVSSSAYRRPCFGCLPGLEGSDLSSCHILCGNEGWDSAHLPVCFDKAFLGLDHSIHRPIRTTQPLLRALAHQPTCLLASSKWTAAASVSRRVNCYILSASCFKFKAQVFQLSAFRSCLLPTCIFISLLHIARQFSSMRQQTFKIWASGRSGNYIWVAGFLNSDSRCFSLPCLASHGIHSTLEGASQPFLCRTGYSHGLKHLFAWLSRHIYTSRASRDSSHQSVLPSFSWRLYIRTCHIGLPPLGTPESDFQLLVWRAPLFCIKMDTKLLSWSKTVCAELICHTQLHQISIMEEEAEAQTRRTSFYVR